MESPRRSVSAMEKVAGFGGGGTGGPVNTQFGSGLLTAGGGVATVSLSALLCVAESAVAKEISFGASEGTGIAAER